MWRPSALFLLSLLCSILLSVRPAAAATVGLSVCNGTEGGGRCGGVGEDDDVEFQLHSEVNRRLLASPTTYIIYSVLDKDRAACEVTGGGRYMNGKCFAMSGQQPDPIPCYYHDQRC